MDHANERTKTYATTTLATANANVRTRNRSGLEPGTRRSNVSHPNRATRRVTPASRERHPGEYGHPRLVRPQRPMEYRRKRPQRHRRKRGESSECDVTSIPHSAGSPRRSRTRRCRQHRRRNSRRRGAVPVYRLYRHPTTSDTRRRTTRTGDRQSGKKTDNRERSCRSERDPKSASSADAGVAADVDPRENAGLHADGGLGAPRECARDHYERVVPRRHADSVPAVGGRLGLRDRPSIPVMHIDLRGHGPRRTRLVGSLDGACRACGHPADHARRHHHRCRRSMRPTGIDGHGSAAADGHTRACQQAQYRRGEMVPRSHDASSA